MKKLQFLLVVLICFATNIQAQNEVITFGSEVFNNYSVPKELALTGATKINVIYTGNASNWDNKEHVKGAFEYACRLWEEKLPSSYPLLIEVKLGTIRSGGIARTVVNKATLAQVPYWGLSTPQALAKRFLFQGNDLADKNEIINDANFLTRPDGVITFNSNDELFYYSIDDTDVKNKYYFVTTALREIAKVLGWYTDATITEAGNALDLYSGENELNLSPYDSWMYGGRSPQSAYNFATSGNVVKSVDYQSNYAFYAPMEFKEGTSLAYFNIDANNDETKLMQPFQNKGEINQHISSAVMKVVNNAVFWNGDHATGDSNYTPIGVADVNVIGFNSSETFSPSNSHSRNVVTAHFDKLKSAGITETSTVNRNFISMIQTNSIDSIFDQFDEYPRETNKVYGWTVSVMKKDGTWDVVLDQRYPNCRFGEYGSITVSKSLFDPIKAANEYARTSEGYLRLRISLYDGASNYWLNDIRKTMCVYRAFDYKPATPSFGFAKFTETNVTGGEWTEDISIGLRNLEGVKSVLVEQWDEWTVPFRYYLDNPKASEFVANVDIEYPTSFKLTYINDNGATICQEPYTHTPSLSPLVLTTKLSANGDVLGLELTPEDYSIKGRKSRRSIDIESYQILNVSNTSYNMVGKNRKTINISRLPKGVYGIKVKDVDGNTYDSRFVK